MRRRSLTADLFHRALTRLSGRQRMTGYRAAFRARQQCDRRRPPAPASASAGNVGRHLRQATEFDDSSCYPLLSKRRSRVLSKTSSSVCATNAARFHTEPRNPWDVHRLVKSEQCGPQIPALRLRGPPYIRGEYPHQGRPRALGTHLRRLRNRPGEGGRISRQFRSRSTRFILSRLAARAVPWKAVLSPPIRRAQATPGFPSSRS